MAVFDYGVRETCGGALARWIIDSVVFITCCSVISQRTFPHFRIQHTIVLLHLTLLSHSPQRDHEPFAKTSART